MSHEDILRLVYGLASLIGNRRHDFFHLTLRREIAEA